MNNIKEILNIKKSCTCFASNSSCKHPVIFIDKNNQEHEDLLFGKFIWEYYEKNNNLENLSLDDFKHFSQYSDNQELKNEIKEKIVNRMLNKGGHFKKSENSGALSFLKHYNPQITYMHRLYRPCPKMLIKFIKLDVEKVSEGYECFWLNKTDDVLSFNQIKIVDENDELIDKSKIEKVTVKYGDKNLVTWFGQCLLERERFKMQNIIPLFKTKLSINIKTEFKVKEIYIQVCCDKININNKYFINNEVLNYDYKTLFNGKLTEEIKLKNLNYYCKELRFILIDKDTKTKIKPDLIKRITIIDLVYDIPTCLLKLEDNILIYDDTNEVIEEDSNSSGFNLDNNKIIIEYRDEINYLNFENINLQIYAKIHVNNFFEGVDNKFNKTDLKTLLAN